MRDFRGKTFEEAFGWTEGNDPIAIHPHTKRRQNRRESNMSNQHIIQRMTPTQKKWFSLMFSSGGKQELICFLKRINGTVTIAGIRHSDFAAIEEYFSGPEGADEQTLCKGPMPVKGKWSSVRGYIEDGFYWFNWRFSNNNRENVCEICVDTSRQLRMLTPNDLISLIKNSIKESKPRILRQLEKDDETIQNELTNSDDKVFIYELLQNANDYPYQSNPVRVEIRCDEQCLCFRHTGRKFSALNVNALCSAGEGEKSENPNAIGYKGIGFKTVFKNNPKVYVNSGEFSFWFDRDRTKKEVSVYAPWRRVPLWEADSPVDMGEYRVGFKLYPEDLDLLRRDNANGYPGILRKMFEDERVLLFIPKVCEAKIIISQDEKWTVQKSGANWCVSKLAPVELSNEIRADIDAQVEARNIPPKFKGKDKTQVSFACRLSGKRLIGIDNTCLYCFLPAEKAQWGFKFLMNTDMVPNGPRDDVRYELNLNKNLSRIAGEQFCVWINQLIISGYDYDSAFRLIPDFELCIVGKTEGVAALIKEFKQGFESKLSTLQIPSDSGELVPIKEIVYDATGVVERLGVPFWKRLNQHGYIAHKTLRGCKEFNDFIVRYKATLGLREFGFAELRAACDTSSELQSWLTNPMANKSFMEFLISIKKNEHDLFKDARIFLDDKGRLGSPQEMYFDSDVEKYLKAFSWCFRYLPSSAPCRDKVDKDWFMPLDPKKLVCDILFSQDNENRVREQLSRANTSRLFWGFLARYKTYTSVIEERYYSNYYRRWQTRKVSKQENSFSQGFLTKLPVVLDNGETARTIVENNKSVFMVEQNETHPAVSDYQWIEPGWVGFIDNEYFDWEEGGKVRDFFLEKRNDGNEEWQLVHSWGLAGILVAIAEKFKGRIQQKMIDSKSDLGFYDFIFECIKKGECTNHKWKAEQLSGWPVLDVQGQLVDSAGKTLFYYDGELVSWLQKGWVENSSFAVLNQKYSSQKELFDLLGVKEYTEDAFGDLFKKHFSNHLTLDVTEKVIAFHRFMATKKSLLNAEQVAELKKAPILVEGNGNPVVGFDGVYLPAEIDIGSDIASGIVSDEIKFLDNALYDDGTMEYWRWLGVKSLDEVEILKKRLEKYLERQKEFVEKGVNDVNFKEYHTSFISALASGGALQMLKDNGCGDLIKIVRLFSKSGELLLPDEMKWSNEFQPLCDFESFDSDGVYVSEMYCGIAGIKELFEELGVKDKFLKSDVGLLANKEFCEYFWKKYLPLNESEWNEIKDYLKADLSCVMDRAGMVRKPEELYHLDIEAYVFKLPNCESKLPMVDGIGKDRLSQLGMKKTLSVGDSLAFLLADSDCKMYKMRGKVLEWIAKGKASTTDAHGLVDKYRSDERAKWRNGQKDPVSVKELCAIRRKNSGQVRIFASDPHVMDLTGLGIGGDGADAMRVEIENALGWLGVQLVDDGSIEIEPSNEHVISDQVISDIAVRVLVFLAERYPDGWEQEFSAGYSRLKDFKFIKCSGLIVRCKDNDWLRAEHGTFLSKGDSVYFVDDWQSKFVYGDMVAELWEKAYKKQYSLDDLKMTLDTSGGDYQLSKRIALDKKNLLDDEQFVQKLQEQFPKVYSMVCDRLCEKECAPTPSTYSENDGQSVVEDAQSSGEEKEQSKALLHEPETKRNYSEDEQEQMFRIFGNGLTVDQMNDENRLVCIRFFNSLKAQGYEPRMLEADFVRDVYNNKKTIRASTIETNDGRQIHVISARKGVAHLPPRWWTRLAKPNNTKYVVCAVLNHLPDGFKYFRCRDDLLTAIGDNLGIIRVHGETAESRLDRTLRLFEFDPELSDFSIYSLLRVKATCDYDAAFREDMRFAESIGYEMGAEEE